MMDAADLLHTHMCMYMHVYMYMVYMDAAVLLHEPRACMHVRVHA